MPVAADIIKIDAPSSAQAGEQVIVDISLKNISGSDQYLSVTAIYDSTLIPFQFDYLLVAPGQTMIFRGWFSMPNKKVRVTAWGWYWTGTEWYQDDTMYIDIALVVEEFVGTISRKELEYDEARAAIPAYNIPQGERGLVHIRGRNDTDVNQKLGIYWIVRDPDGITVQEYYDWETFWTGPGSEHEFIAGRFNLDKVGTYGIQVGLLMNPDEPAYVDIYYGDLCTVAAAVPEPEFAGFGITEYTKR